jgi:hypothetical protein
MRLVGDDFISELINIVSRMIIDIDNTTFSIDRSILPFTQSVKDKFFFNDLYSQHFLTLSKRFVNSSVATGVPKRKLSFDEQKLVDTDIYISADSMSIVTPSIVVKNVSQKGLFSVTSGILMLVELIHLFQSLDPTIPEVSFPVSKDDFIQLWRDCGLDRTILSDPYSKLGWLSDSGDEDGSTILFIVLNTLLNSDKIVSHFVSDVTAAGGISAYSTSKRFLLSRGRTGYDGWRPDVLSDFGLKSVDPATVEGSYFRALLILIDGSSYSYLLHDLMNRTFKSLSGCFLSEIFLGDSSFKPASPLEWKVLQYHLSSLRRLNSSQSRGYLEYVSQAAKRAVVTSPILEPSLFLDVVPKVRSI